MMFQYRLKYYKNEEGEYTAPLPCDQEIITSIISSHWTGDNLPNGLEIIAIKKEDGPSLLLEHNKKGVFEVYYLPLSISFHYHKKSRIGLIYESTDLFFANQISDLEHSLNKTSKENKYIRGDFYFKNHNYQLTSKKHFTELYWLLWWGPLIVMLWAAFVKQIITTPIGTAIDFSLLTVAILFTMLYLPGLWLHFQYKRDNKNLKVKITRGEEIIDIQTSKGLIRKNKSEIKSVIKVENASYKIPWSEYGYTEIEFVSGEVLNLTNLMVDQFRILDKFAFDNIEIQTLKMGVPGLQRKTTIN